mmetsp:Transcript_2268/g.4552  ORF Transcript_2268/g.4552 Transcript_2268/m.4552 type:complete len:428 (-) Transcript_2268:46-1329(-)
MGAVEPTEMALAARSASRSLQAISSAERAAALHRVADALVANEAEILKENLADIAESEKNAVDPALLNRLKLKDGKIAQLAQGVRSLADMEEPIGRCLRHTQVAEGLVLKQVTSPLGVLLIIFESRPDALPQIASLAIRSGNGLLLKGGKEATRSNIILHRVITEALKPTVDPSLIGLVTTREGIDDLLKLHHVIDLVIPRGSNQLVNYIQSNTKIPVMGHADGVCHVYVDDKCDMEKAVKIAVDSKVDYPAACNAMETLLVHESLQADGRLTTILSALKEAGVELFGGARAAAALGLPPCASPKIEYGTLACTVELVAGLDAAIDHVHAHGSSHTECIVTEDDQAAQQWLQRVDSACIFHNASTRFADGFRFGLGAEVGISTGRIHARGPVGVDGLLTTRWLMQGNGHIVEKDAKLTYVHKSLPLV